MSKPPRLERVTQPQQGHGYKTRFLAGLKVVVIGVWTSNQPFHFCTRHEPDPPVDGTLAARLQLHPEQSRRADSNRY
jgi:hypothetical protein